MDRLAALRAKANKLFQPPFLLSWGLNMFNCGRRRSPSPPKAMAVMMQVYNLLYYKEGQCYEPIC